MAHPHGDSARMVVAEVPIQGAVVLPIAAPPQIAPTGAHQDAEDAVDIVESTGITMVDMVRAIVPLEIRISKCNMQWPISKVTQQR